MGAANTYPGAQMELVSLKLEVPTGGMGTIHLAQMKMMGCATDVGVTTSLFVRRHQQEKKIIVLMTPVWPRALQDTKGGTSNMAAATIVQHKIWG